MHSLKERENFVIDETIRVEVAYAKCDIQRLLEIQVIAGTTARDAEHEFLYIDRTLERAALLTLLLLSPGTAREAS